MTPKLTRRDLFKKKRRPCWRERMTLCIAAACQDRGKKRIVISSDWRIESSSFGAEIQDKLYWIGDEWAVLIAGGITRAIELVDTYAEHFRSLKEKKIKLTDTTILDQVKKPPILQKYKIANEYVGALLGMTYRDFLTNGKQILPEKQFEEIIADLQRLDLGCQLILCSFVDGAQRIYKVCDDCSVEASEHFAAIGTGSDIAESVLFQRDHEGDLPLSHALYDVFEAASLGSKAPGVGKQHAITVLVPPRLRGKIAYSRVSDRGYRFLERCFKKYGPRNFYRLGLPTGTLDSPTE
jgi:20S proteasome alpha/beta subunit